MTAEVWKLIRRHVVGHEARARWLYTAALGAVATVMLIEVVILPGQIFRRHWTEASPAFPNQPRAQQSDSASLSPGQNLQPVDPLAGERQRVRLAVAPVRTELQTSALAWRSLREKVTATLGVDLAAPDQTVRAKPVLAEVVRQEPTARSSWTILRSLVSSEAAVRQESSVLVQEAETITITSADEAARLIERLDVARAQLVRQTKAFQTAAADVKHLAVLVEAVEFEKHLQH